MVGIAHNIFIGRLCESDEYKHIRKAIKNLPEDTTLNTDWEDENPTFRIDGYPVVISETDYMYVVQYYIATLDDEGTYMNDEIYMEGIDYTKFPLPHDKRYKMMSVDSVF